MRNKPTSAGRRPTGIDEAQTRAHGEALDTALRESVATKADITRLEIDITSLDRKIELAVRDLTIRMGAIAMALFAALTSIKFFGLRKQFARAHKHFDEIGRRLDEMVRLRLNPLAYLLLAGMVLAGCNSSMKNPFSGVSNPFSSPAPPPPPAAFYPPSVRAEDIVGRWGFSSYHRDQDRPRTEAAAKGQCNNPYVINQSASGGVMMLGHDSPTIQDMTLKGSVEGKTYIGPGPDPAGADDREVVSFDGRMLILRWVDPEVAGRYGTAVLVRCGAEGTQPTRAPAAPPPPPLLR